MAKEATNPRASMQREWYCLVVHKNNCERTFKYAEAEKQTAEKANLLTNKQVSHLQYLTAAVLNWR